MDDNFGKMLDEQEQNNPTLIYEMSRGRSSRGGSGAIDAESLWIEHEAFREMEKLIEDHIFYARFEEEMAHHEIRLSKENGANIVWARRKQIELEESYMWEFYKTWKIIDRIKTKALISTLILPEPGFYANARIAYRTLLNIVIVRTEIGDIIPDDENP